jgi:TRAP-type C4-dicarboxylate transport system permease large subunit
VICSIWGELTLAKLIEAIYQSVLLFSSIGFLVLGATILAQSVSILGLPQQILEGIAQSGFGTYSVLIIVILIYLVLGCFFDGLSLMIMTLPVVFPLLTGLGFDPIWIGVIITIVIEIGQITPPVGLNLSVLTALTNNEVSLGPSCLCDSALLAYPPLRYCGPNPVPDIGAFLAKPIVLRSVYRHENQTKAQDFWSCFCVF